MSDEQLRAIYDARVASSAPVNRANCPLPEQLQRLVESGAGGDAPNLQLLDHVFGCAHCRPEFALLRAVATSAETGDGASVASVKASKRWFTGPRLAIAAALLVAIGIGGESLRRMNRGGATSDQVRSVPNDASDVLIVTPGKDDVFSAQTQFVWRKVPDAITYEVQLLDTTGAVLATHITSDTVFNPSADERTKLNTAKLFDWFVTARRADGNERRSNVARVIPR